MNKERLEREINQIEVPMDDVFKAIHNGIKQGRRERSPRRRTLKRLGAYSSVAAAVFLASGLVFAPITNVLAAVPLIGSIYEKFSFQIGEELYKSNLITELNQKASDHGVDITLTSAYYDGSVIGITFKAEGEMKDINKIGDEGPEAGYAFHLFDGDEQKQWSGGMTGLEKTEDGYVGAIELYNPKADLATNFTLPVTFSYMAGVKGDWKFDVPVKQIPAETIPLKAESSYNGGEYALQMESITKGKATTLLNYKVLLPQVGKDDAINLTVFDDKGNVLSKSQEGYPLSIKEKNGAVEKDIRALIATKLGENVKYITIHPEIERYEQNTVASLEQSAPFMVESDRFDYKIRINKVEQRGSQLLIDYNVLNVDANTISMDIVENFAEYITIIDKDKLVLDDDGELDLNKMIGYQILSINTKSIGGTSHYQSTYKIENDNKEYSILVPFGTLSLNDKDLTMDPIKVNLK